MHLTTRTLRTLYTAHVLLISFIFFFYCYGAHRDLHSFPTRRSSDLAPPLRASSCPQRRRARGPPPPCLQLRSRQTRSEEHTSELQSRGHLVCRLLLEKKKK